MAFYVGQKVVCVNDKYTEPGWILIPNRPRVGTVYTVRALMPPEYYINDSRAILLNEITNPAAKWSTGVWEGAFNTSRFRPAVERKTDISIFTAMLTPNRQSVDA